jgi:hypothetical protein
MDGARCDDGAQNFRITGTLRYAATVLLLFVVAFAGLAQELRPESGEAVTLAFPLPVSGYDVYMVGELHGVKETEGILLQYLARLYEGAGLRDVALEDKSAYQRDAQAYVEGKSKTLPAPLCLRAGVLDAIRRFNEGRKGSELIHVHLVDIDFNAEAIREHLLTLKKQIPGSETLSVPALGGIKAHGLETVSTLQRLTKDQEILGELRTLGHSIRAYQQGMDGGTGDVKGSPYLNDREDAAASNIIDLHNQHGLPVLLYGNDHVSKVPLHNGGPNQDTDFPPLALRLDRAGIKVFSLVTFPLAGRSNWRGHEGELMWTASDGSLSNGLTLDRVLASDPASKFLYIDPRREPVKLPSQDLTRSRADAFLLLAHGTPAENRCAVR